jgi:hypothetical protein
MLDLFANRQPGQVIQRASLMSLGEMVLNDWDLQTVDTPVRLNMEYDFKRRPVDARMVRIESLGVEHLAFATVPWDNAAEGELARMLFDRWREGNRTRTGTGCGRRIASRPWRTGATGRRSTGSMRATTSGGRASRRCRRRPT